MIESDRSTNCSVNLDSRSINSRQLTTIVPRLPPAIDGLGDYGLSLAKQLYQDYDLTTEFLVGDPDWIDESTIEEFAVEQVDAQLVSSLSKCLTHRSTVLLHYVGYGYAKRGCPSWLVNGLERWKLSGSNRCLITMFHELYANGPIWTSAFWTSPLQKNLTTRLACLSDYCITNRRAYAKVLHQLSQAKHTNILSLPVFSTVGEPSAPKPLHNRPRRLVVFGGQGARSRVYQQSRAALERTCHELQIEEILDIGPPLNFQIQPFSKTLLTCLGIRPKQEVSELLSSSVVGFFNYPNEFLAKSTIFAAYCAHGMLAIGHTSRGQDTDSLKFDKHYWLVEQQPRKMNLETGQVVADNAFEWYQNHRLVIQSHYFSTYLGFASQK